jgi:hypothetical protein
MSCRERSIYSIDLKFSAFELFYAARDVDLNYSGALQFDAQPGSDRAKHATLPKLGCSNQLADAVAKTR